MMINFALHHRNLISNKILKQKSLANSNNSTQKHKQVSILYSALCAKGHKIKMSNMPIVLTNTVLNALTILVYLMFIADL